MNTGIYAIKNKINEKILIGSSINTKNRLNYHFRELRLNRHYNKLLQEDYNTFGGNNFEKLIIETCDKEKLEKMELYYINKFNSYNQGYNATICTKRSNTITQSIPFVVHDLLLDKIYYLKSLGELASFFGKPKCNNIKQKIVFDGRYIKYKGTNPIKFKKCYIKDLKGIVTKEYPSIYHLSYDINIPLYIIKYCLNNNKILSNTKFLVSTNKKKTPYIEKRGVYNKDSLKKPIYSIDQYGKITYYDSVKEAASTMSNKSAYRKIQECVTNKYKFVNKYKNLYWYRV